MGLDLAWLVSVTLQRCSDVVEFLAEEFFVADVVCPADQGPVDR